MGKKYKGRLSLEWYNKQKSILLKDSSASSSRNDVLAPYITWVNADEALYYEIDDRDGMGVVPYWVDRNDIRVKEARPLKHIATYESVKKETEGKIPGITHSWEIQESTQPDIGIGNTLVQGDSLLVLNTLKKHFSHLATHNKVKCIFIDPPYNTQSAFKHYDDNLAHSEWLTMMRDRLLLLRSILSEEGSIWITIDDGESHYLKVLCDEIFGRDQFIAEIIWQKRTSRENRAAIGSSHDSILVYAKKPAVEWKQFRNKLDPNQLGYSNPDNDTRGPWRSIPFSAQGFRKNQMYQIETPTGNRHDPPKGRCWAATEPEYLRLKDDNRVYFPRNGLGRPRIKRFIFEDDGLVPMSLWLAKDAGTTEESKKEILKLFPDSEPFATPKPEKLIYQILTIATNENDLVLDCFGGSGTTFAVAHKMRRRWIGIESGSHSEEYIIERLKQVISGSDQGGISKKVNWTGGGKFNYYKLGQSIIRADEDGGLGFNWNLGTQYIQEAFLSSYDYNIDNDISLDGTKLFSDSSDVTIGTQRIGNSIRVAIVSLVSPNDSQVQLAHDEVFYLCDVVRQKYSPEFVNIFTNRGVELSVDTKPNYLEIIKIPHAIFAELEK